MSFGVAQDGRVSWGTTLGNETRKSFSEDIQTESIEEGIASTEPRIMGGRLSELQESEWEVRVWWLCRVWTHNYFTGGPWGVMQRFRGNRK